jgi:hypothetical protein
MQRDNAIAEERTQDQLLIWTAFTNAIDLKLMDELLRCSNR